MGLFEAIQTPRRWSRWVAPVCLIGASVGFVMYAAAEERPLAFFRGILAANDPDQSFAAPFEQALWVALLLMAVASIVAALILIRPRRVLFALSGTWLVFAVVASAAVLAPTEADMQAWHIATTVPLFLANVVILGFAVVGTVMSVVGWRVTPPTHGFFDWPMSPSTLRRWFPRSSGT